MFCFTASQRFLSLKVPSTSGEAVTDARVCLVRVRVRVVTVVTISILALLAVRILFASWLILAL